MSKFYNLSFSLRTPFCKVDSLRDKPDIVDLPRQRSAGAHGLASAGELPVELPGENPPSNQNSQSPRWERAEHCCCCKKALLGSSLRHRWLYLIHHRLESAEICTRAGSSCAAVGGGLRSVWAHCVTFAIHSEYIRPLRVIWLCWTAAGGSAVHLLLFIVLSSGFL